MTESNQDVSGESPVVKGRPGRPRGPGRPPGSRDVRPMLLKMLEKYRLFPLLFKEFDDAKKSMTAKERLMFSLELAKLGISACPKNVNVDVSQPRLMIDPSLGCVPNIPLHRSAVAGELGPAVKGEPEVPHQVYDYRLIDDGESSDGEER